MNIDQAPQKIIFLLRVAMGWMYAYAGITKILDPHWSAAGFLTSAKTFSGMYAWFASPSILPAINVINEWALLLLGISLLLGLCVRLSATLGISLMVLYYLPNLHFPYVGNNYFLVDEHVIFILILTLLIKARAGRIWGLESWPRLRRLFGE